jgi:hypothetical protein
MGHIQVIFGVINETVNRDTVNSVLRQHGTFSVAQVQTVNAAGMDRTAATAFDETIHYSSVAHNKILISH